MPLARQFYHWQREPCVRQCARRPRATGRATAKKQTTLWQIASRDQEAETVHGTQKPVKCMRQPILNNSSPGQAVYEPFSGSGTTAVVAKTTGPSCLAGAFDPASCRRGGAAIGRRFHRGRRRPWMAMVGALPRSRWARQQRGSRCSAAALHHARRIEAEVENCLAAVPERTADRGLLAGRTGSIR